MVDLGAFLSDPWTLRAIVSVIAGSITGLVVVRLTFFLHNQRDLFKSVRSLASELRYDIDKLAMLSRLLQDDMQQQHVDLPVEVPAGTTIEVRYVLSLPGSLTTSAFDQLRHSGRLMELSPEVRSGLFDLYDTIDRINRLRQHRETLHYNNVGNVHIVIDPSELDIERGTTVKEADLPPAIRRRLDELRQMRRAMMGINTSILRLIATISSPDMVEELELESYVETDSTRVPREGNGGRPPERDAPDIEEMISILEDVEQRSFWSRFV